MAPSLLDEIVWLCLHIKHLIKCLGELRIVEKL